VTNQTTSDCPHDLRNNKKYGVQFVRSKFTIFLASTIMKKNKPNNHTMYHTQIVDKNQQGHGASCGYRRSRGQGGRKERIGD
jgi:hypothetical protein